MVNNIIKFKLESYTGFPSGYIQRQNYKTYAIEVSPSATFGDILRQTGLDKFNAQVISWNRGNGYDLVKPETQVLSDEIYSHKYHHYLIRVPENGIRGYNLAEKSLENTLNSPDRLPWDKVKQEMDKS
jgi:hypothetical protein